MGKRLEDKGVEISSFWIGPSIEFVKRAPSLVQDMREWEEMIQAKLTTAQKRLRKMAHKKATSKIAS